MKTIIFIHGMFQNAVSWDPWVAYFSQKRYQCIAESWPMHDGTPSTLRNNIPEGLGDLRLEQVVEKYERLATAATGEIIFIGHSVGGLIAQLLINKGIGSAAVCISSVAPNRMLAFDWNFFKNSLTITNPFQGDEPFYMDEDGFFANFGNTMPRPISDAAFLRTAVHDSRNILRDCMLGPGELDTDKTVKPLLFIAAAADQITPPELNQKNAKAYADGLADYKEFSDRGHFICGQPGWEEVADYTEHWLITKNLVPTF